MKIRVLVAMAGAVITYHANAGGQAAKTWHRVDVEISSHVDLPAALLKDSRDAATTIFAGIFVQLNWAVQSQTTSKLSASCVNESPTQEIAVEIAPHAPASFSSAALAVAMPYAASGVRIVIFYDRVAPLLRGHHAPQAKILGYVLAHEIGHVLEGVARHSETGVMRARWLENDFKQMGMGALTFTKEDVQLIRRRLTPTGASAFCSGDAGSNPTATLNRPAA